MLKVLVIFIFVFSVAGVAYARGTACENQCASIYNSAIIHCETLPKDKQATCKKNAGIQNGICLGQCTGE